ncbi:MAG: class E sortase, partial [Peptococcaceae bacterium]|nr:class E sortase [Peptococcaceae bacterium]
GSVIAIQNLLPYLLRDPEHVATTPVPEEPYNDEPIPVVFIPDSEVETEAESEEDPSSSLPVGKLVITNERKQYEDQTLTLAIPALDLTCPVYDGTSTEVLNQMGAGLYEYAQLPGRGNRNTSMAGHRNTSRFGIITDNAPFYYIDLLKEGDFLYLYDDESIFRYAWEFCEIVEQDDWDVIRTAGYPCLTITSCHPIGISDHRIIVRGRLDDIFPYQADYVFLAFAPADIRP